MVNLCLALPLGQVGDVPSTMPRIPKGIVGCLNCWVDVNAILGGVFIEVIDCGQAIVHNLSGFDANFMAILGFEQVNDGLVVGEHMRWVGE